MRIGCKLLPNKKKKKVYAGWSFWELISQLNQAQILFMLAIWQFFKDIFYKNSTDFSN